MASPQKENGYTAIANEILEAMARTPLNGTQFRILISIWRSTYGWNKSSHEISIRFLLQALGMNESQYMQIKREVDKLIDCKILIEEKAPSKNSTRVIRFNKNWNEWITIENEIAKKKTGSKSSRLKSPVDELVYSTVDELVYSTSSLKSLVKKKDNKEILKDIYEHFEKLWELYPRKKGKSSVSDAKKKELYKISFEEMERAINRYKKEIDANKTDEQFIKFGSSFFNTSYTDYLDANYREPEPIPVKRISAVPKGVTLI